MKRQAKTKEKARKKRQVRLVKPPPIFMERPPISQMEAPKGFMAISASQALMEYAKPLMEKNAESLDELNRRMELASSLWNLAINRQKGDQQEYSRWMERAKASAKKVLNLDGAERDRYIAEMIERQVHLFPKEVQPAPPSMFRYMRKVICKPLEYLYWQPSLKLFYRFLHEKGFLSLNETAVLLGRLDAMERHFLEILQQRYH